MYFSFISYVINTLLWKVVKYKHAIHWVNVCTSEIEKIINGKKKMEWSISGYYIRCCCIKWKDQIDNNLFTSEGDGRMDSPGHCAQFCSYTFMEYETKKILSIVTMDKRMTDKKSTVLEKACFLKGLRELLAKNLKVVEVVTDAHPQIESLMS